MIYDASTFDLPIRVAADLVVVGSGAGGATAAAVAAEAGLDVVLLESGPFVPPSIMNQREEDMMPELLVANGSQQSSDGKTTIIQGRALGGSTVHNTNLCKRIPDEILAEWEHQRGMKHLSRERWNELYEEIEEALAIDYIEAELYNRHNQLFRRGCRELGWEASGLMHNRTGCVASGYCSVGCSYDAKNNATKIYVPRIVRAGGQIFSHCQAIRVIHRDGQAQGIEAVALDPYTRQPRGKVIIEAPQVCLSASATGTPAILLRSDIPDPSGRTGEGLTIHPALIAAGEFEEEVHAWRGIPQSYQCTEFLDFQAAHPPPDATPEQLARKDEVGNRSWLVPVFAHPMSTATLLPGWGREHRELMEGYDRLAAYTAMIHDISEGSVRPDGDLGVDIQWKPDEADRRELLFGLERAVELLFASGAKRVVVPSRPLMIFEPGDSLSSIAEIDLESGAVDMTAVHPMSSVSMGDDPAMAVVDSRGAHHQIDGLWVADGSLFPSSIGGPPQVSIYALGLHVGQHIAGTD